jgi:K+-transporting ATPase A subunit
MMLETKVLVWFVFIYITKCTDIIEMLKNNKGLGGSTSWVVGLPNNSYKPITNIFNDLIDLIFDVLTPLSAIFQLYHGD